MRRVVANGVTRAVTSFVSGKDHGQDTICKSEGATYSYIEAMALTGSLTTVVLSEFRGNQSLTARQRNRVSKTGIKVAAFRIERVADVATANKRSQMI
ncbi:MAG: hypothetical protein AB1631_24275 [Acidobacteriota bacterium]